MSVENIISAKVEQNAAAAQPADFSTAMIAGYHNKWADLQRRYDSLQGMLDDGFVAGEPIYQSAVALLANGYSGEFVVGRLQSPYTESYKVTPANVIENQVFSLRITRPDGTSDTITHNALVADTVETVCDALKVAIDALSLPLTVTDNVTDLDIVADNAGEHYCIDILSRFENLQLQDNTLAPAGLDADLSAIEAINDDFYGVTLERASAAQAQVLAVWASTRRLLSFYATSDYDALTSATTDVGSLLQASGQKRITGFWAEAACEYADAAWMGTIMSNNPGVEDAVYQELVGVSQTGRLTANMRANLRAKNLTYFQLCGTQARTFDADGGGKTANGDFIDITRGTDWYVNLSQTNLANAVLGGNLPYTNASVEVLKAVQRATNNFAVGRGFIDANHTVTAPTIEEVPAATRQERCFGDIVSTARYAGKIRKVKDLCLSLSF